jgi:hypothetical protein
LSVRDMNPAAALPPGGKLTTNRKGWTAPVARVSEADGLSLSREPVQGDLEFGYPDPYADEPRWPAWKVTVAVVVFCGAFWTGIGYLATRLLG